MSTLESVPGAGLCVNREYTITDGNNRCQIVFKEDFADIRGLTLQTLHDRGLFDDQTLQQWERAITTILDGDETEINEQIQLTPVGSTETYVYDLTVTPVPDEDEVCCSMRSVGTSQRYDETITALHVATRDLMTADDTEEVLHRTAVAANEVLGFPGTAVREYDERDEMLRHVAFGARVKNIDSRPPYHVDDSPHGRAIRRGETIIDDIDSGDDPYDRGVFTQTMYIPIGTAGLLSVGTVGNTFDETDVQFAEILAENAEAAIRVVDTTTSLREERERLELLRQILTRVLRHNIRNDMNVIKGHAEILGNCVDDGDHKFVENIIASVENVTTLSEKAREIERIIGKSHARRRLAVDSVVENAVNRTTQQFPSATIRTDIDDAEVYAHSSLDVALTNLLENACEHTESTDSAILVSATATDDTVRLAVHDDGPGIPDAEIEVLEAMSETKLEHGSGLGLWIVNWVVEQSDGTLTFDTSDGTCVELALDRASDAPN
jgi:signal transduction histidine kinase